MRAAIAIGLVLLISSLATADERRKVFPAELRERDLPPSSLGPNDPLLPLIRGSERAGQPMTKTRRYKEPIELKLDQLPLRGA